jgi:hypothetical protein
VSPSSHAGKTKQKKSQVPVAPTTQEAEVRRITVQSQPYLEKTHHKKGLVRGAEFKSPSTAKKKKKRQRYKSESDVMTPRRQSNEPGFYLGRQTAAEIRFCGSVQNSAHLRNMSFKRSEFCDI